MDKKTQFQIQTSQGKLIKYKETLETLQESRDILIKNSTQSNSDNSIIIELKQKYSNLESKQQLLKKDINANVNNISNANNNLLVLDKLKDNKLNEEDTILLDEINRIEENKIEVLNKHKLLLDSSYNDKIELINNIELIKNELEIQNNIIAQLQIESHSSRQQILNDLHDKKQNKINLQEHIDNFEINNNNFTLQIQELENQNTQLIEFKKLLIDFEYNIDSNTNTNTNTNNIITLSNYYTIFNDLDLDKTIPINDKIFQIDKLIKNNKSKIDFINKKYNKSTQSNSIKLKMILETYNKINRIKIIGSKEILKIEKEKKHNLEIILEDMKNKYNIFETDIINNIYINLENKNNEIKSDKIRSDERLIIMKKRIIEDYENEKDRLNNIIITSKINLDNIQNDFNNLTIDINNTKDLIEKENSIENELNKIDSEILNYKNIIKQIENDIEKLSSIV
jgi:hypothetical protein